MQHHGSLDRFNKQLAAGEYESVVNALKATGPLHPSERDAARTAALAHFKLPTNAPEPLALPVRTPYPKRLAHFLERLQLGCYASAGEAGRGTVWLAPEDKATAKAAIGKHFEVPTAPPPAPEPVPAAPSGVEGLRRKLQAGLAEAQKLVEAHKLALSLLEGP
jgi:hypothetical protein